jgi:hypothetical protein
MDKGFKLSYNATFLDENEMDIKMSSKLCVAPIYELIEANFEIKADRLFVMYTLVYGSECWSLGERRM